MWTAMFVQPWSHVGIKAKDETADLYDVRDEGQSADESSASSITASFHKHTPPTLIFTLYYKLNTFIVSRIYLSVLTGYIVYVKRDVTK